MNIPITQTKLTGPKNKVMFTLVQNKIGFSMVFMTLGIIMGTGIGVYLVATDFVS